MNAFSMEMRTSTVSHALPECLQLITVELWFCGVDSHADAAIDDNKSV